MEAGVESEIKLKTAGAEPARRALGRLGAALARPRHFEDNVLFDDDRGSLLGRGALLRLRRTSEGGVVTFKGPRRIVEGIKSREEIEAATPEPDALQAIFEAVGLRPVFRYQKYREVYAWKGVEIVVDETPVGTFLELEGPLDAIHAAAAALGYGPADYITDSYAGLFFASGGTGDMVFK